MLKTSLCAFSISSNNTILYGFLLTASVSCPPSSYPTYPGGAPTSLDTLNASIYSLMSILTICLSSSNSSSASVFATSVFPTPVGPRNINEPIGLFGSFIPARALIIASLTSVSALSCPFTLFIMLFLRFNNFSFSPPTSFFTGIFVHFDIISAIFSSSTVSLNICDSSTFLKFSNSFSSLGIVPCRSIAASSRSYLFSACSSLNLAVSNSSFFLFIKSFIFFSFSHFCLSSSSCFFSIAI